MIKHCLLAVTLALAACAQFPVVDRAEASRLGPRPAMPELMPVDVLLDESRFAAPRAEGAGRLLEARAAALRQRAAALRRAKPAG